MLIKTKGINTTKLVKTGTTNFVFHFEKYNFKFEYIKGLLIHLQIFKVVLINYYFNSENIPF